MLGRCITNSRFSAISPGVSRRRESGLTSTQVSKFGTRAARRTRGRAPRRPCSTIAALMRATPLVATLGSDDDDDDGTPNVGLGPPSLQASDVRTISTPRAAAASSRSASATAASPAAVAAADARAAAAAAARGVLPAPPNWRPQLAASPASTASSPPGSSTARPPPSVVHPGAASSWYVPPPSRREANLGAYEVPRPPPLVVPHDRPQSTRGSRRGEVGFNARFACAGACGAAPSAPSARRFTNTAADALPDTRVPVAPRAAASPRGSGAFSFCPLPTTGLPAASSAPTGGGGEPGSSSTSEPASSGRVAVGSKYAHPRREFFRSASAPMRRPDLGVEQRPRALPLMRASTTPASAELLEAIRRHGGARPRTIPRPTRALLEEAAAARAAPNEAALLAAEAAGRSKSARERRART